jgi:hypothetical protein
MLMRGERGPGLPGQKLSSGQFLAANARSASGRLGGGFPCEGAELGDVEGGKVLVEKCLDLGPRQAVLFTLRFVAGVLVELLEMHVRLCGQSRGAIP